MIFIFLVNKTEGALILMASTWGYDYEILKQSVYNERRDKIYSFNSLKKRSTAVIHRPDGKYIYKYKINNK